MTKPVLSGLEPERVFYYFEQLCRIPHGSGNTKEISDYLVSVASELQLECRQDEVGNVVIRKPAAAGYEQAPVVMLQGHMDMVAEKTTDSSHDFTKDPLSLFIEEDWIGAQNTTLGADDGIAVAYMLALLSEPEAEHPALECVFTVDEETGLLGANAIDLSDSKASYLINLDSENEGIFLASCAGGTRIDLTLPIHRIPVKGSLYRITLDGCLGGHSGTEIDKGRANAVCLMGRLLNDVYLQDELSFCLVSLDGGLKDNAIPRSAAALIAADDSLEFVQQVIERQFEIYKKEYAGADPDMFVSVEKAEGESGMLDYHSQSRLLFLLQMAPNGVQAMTWGLKELVETSLNAGIMKTQKDWFQLSFSIRSSVESRKQELVNRLTSLVEYLGGEAATRGDYPGWAYQQESPLRSLLCDCWKKETGREARVQAIHAGLECGLLLAKLPQLDIVSMGPDMKDIHTPGERLSISSTQRCYRVLLRALKEIK